MALKCLLVDDEFNNRDLLRILIERYCPELEVSGMASSVMEAAEHIRSDEAILTRAPQTRIGDSGRLTKITGWSGQSRLCDFVERLVAEHRATVGGSQ
jgi:hypothetical protein